MSDSSTDKLSPADRRNARLGLILFGCYFALYAGFVLLNAFAADRTEQIVAAGLNLAVVYGFFLIIAAVVLSAVYGMMCRTDPTPAAGKAASTGTESQATGDGQ